MKTIEKWFYDRLLRIQYDEVIKAVNHWKGSPNQFKKYHKRIARMPTVDAVTGSTIINDWFSHLPMGTILWHATYDINWTYDKDLWLSTSYDREKALETKSGGANPVYLVKIRIDSESVSGLPCYTAGCNDDAEVLLARRLKLTQLQLDDDSILFFSCV